MNKVEKLRDELEQSLVRGLSLRWSQDVNIKECQQLIGLTLSLLEIWPTKAGVWIDIFRKYKTKIWKTPNEFDLGEFAFIEAVHFEFGQSLSITNRANFLANLSLDLKSLYLTNSPKFLTLETALNAISNWLDVITPFYGFSDVESFGYSSSFHSAVPTNGPNEIWIKQVQAHQAVRNCKPHEDGYLGKRLLDIFELNILSPAHLSSRVFGKSLEDWIISGSRGTLIVLKKDVYAWIVPDVIRPDIRQNFLKAGHLIVPV
jgi:hypothetical protein